MFELLRFEARPLRAGLLLLRLHQGHHPQREIAHALIVVAPEHAPDGAHAAVRTNRLGHVDADAAVVAVIHLTGIERCGIVGHRAL